MVIWIVALILFWILIVSLVLVFLAGASDRRFENDS